MDIKKRAILYLIRKKGRTFLMLLFLVIISLSILVGLSFKEKAETELDRLRLSLASGFVLRADIENEMYHEFVEAEYGGGGIIYTGPVIDTEMIEKICSVEGVEDFVADLSGNAMWTDLKVRPGAWADTKAVPGDPYLTEDAVRLYRQRVSFSYCRNGEKQKYFRTGALSIVEGRNIREGDHLKAVVSDWLAEKNQLSVGDVITVETKEGIYRYSDESLRTWGEPIKIVIVGLFHANFKQESSMYSDESELIENCIFTDMDTYAKNRDNMKQEDFGSTEPDRYTRVEFLVEDPKKLDTIIQQVKDQDGLDLENMELVVEDMDYRAAAKPYSQIHMLAMVLLVCGLFGMGIILYLVIRFWMYGRIYEIGILRSIGLKKREILGQMIAECLMASAAALLIAFLLSVPALDRCASAVERATGPKAGKEAYEARISKRYDLEIIKTSSDVVELDHFVSIDQMVLAIFFVCGISCISVLFSFTMLSRLKWNKLLM